ncbi:DUF4148 domain-containing protein [Noviherbaspirillum sp.]|uniref:DUF4148 domain-containing protein n=1 Tax=Noviherbaspirillum sp. TaxID=1926288 RepID=UPI002D4D39E2|nr:DUF4148 domain-containing protein [Noviherbaspirillum sp.]HZW21240.1 DUF4148 domain-containing protein [Noviherbaspirillum sp.]
MNAKHIIAALAVFATAGSACADNGIFVEHVNVPLTKTRAEVRAELEQDRGAERIAGSSAFVEHNAVASSKTRDEVRGEAVQAARRDTVRSPYFGG